MPFQQLKEGIVKSTRAVVGLLREKQTALLSREGESATIVLPNHCHVRGGTCEDEYSKINNSPFMIYFNTISICGALFTTLLHRPHQAYRLPWWWWLMVTARLMLTLIKMTATAVGEERLEERATRTSLRETQKEIQTENMRKQAESKVM